MSHTLWRSYWENDVDRFRRLVAPAPVSKHVGGPNGFRHGGSSGPGANLGKAEINSRDHAGLTLLLRAASSTSENAIAIVEALLEHPAIDIYARDPESGWNALHRALYAGNIAIARLLLRAEQRIMTETLVGTANSRVGQLIKTKDREGNSPFDLYNSTIAARRATDALEADDSDTESTVSSLDEMNRNTNDPHGLPGDELYTFGSNKNLSLGVGDESDRQFPERLQLHRPEHLIESLCRDSLEATDAARASNNGSEEGAVPALMRERPMHIRDVVLAKFHSAVLTNDPVSNLYICGVGRGGRLGLGDENTRFRFVPVQGPLSGRRVSHVALGQNHTLAVVGNGELWSWGSNAMSQLGYALPTPARADEEPVSLTPRQVFGPLKKEVIVGIAASAVHSVAHSSSSLYCWGRNLGQLGLMDADSRSLEIQSAPRKVAASLISTPILMVSAIDKATTCLLASNTVFVFTSYGYNIVKFPAPDIFVNTRLGASSTSRTPRNLNKIKAISSGGEAIATLSARGDLFLMNLNHHVDTMSATSTTNPVKIKKGAVSQAQCIWSAKKEGVTSFGVGENGSVIISTESGAVWRRVKRSKAKDAAAPGSGEIKRKHFKFQRVPGITNAVTVRSSTFGAFAAIRRDCTSVAERIEVTGQSLWDDLASLCPLEDFESRESHGGNAKPSLKYWDAELAKKKIGQTAYQVLKSPDLESDLEPYLGMLGLGGFGFDAVACTMSAPGLVIPIHAWVLAARSTVLRKALASFRDDGQGEIPEVLKIERNTHGQAVLTFDGLDIFSLLNLVLYAYKDEVVPVWNYLREVPHLSFRYRQVRVELMKLAARLNMMKLEAGARMQARIIKSLDEDFRLAVQDHSFLESGDALLELDGAEVPVHSYLLRRRCPFFHGLFAGRSDGGWLAGRLERQAGGEEMVRVDLSHFEPRAFRHVLLHMYGDVGLGLFDEVISSNIDQFSELVMDVMSMANELMLDRLSQICQQVISRFVTGRNISHLLNEISPCSVEDFKNAGLEYACLHMEMMLENHLLDDLDDDLMYELDEVVRENQLARAPFSRSGRAEMLLHERYPELVEDIEEERRRRAKEMAWKAAHKEDERKLSLSYRTKFGSLEDGLQGSPTGDKPRRKPRAASREPNTPPLRPQASQGDLIFNMDEDEAPLERPEPESPLLRQADKRTPCGTSRSGTRAQRRQPLDLTSPVSSPSTPSKGDGYPREAKAGSPWGAPALPVDKLDLRSIMSQDAGPSGIATGLAAQKSGETVQTPKATPGKLSQKERKRQQQLEASQRQAEREQASESKVPWKVARVPRMSLKDVFSPLPASPTPQPTPPPRAVSGPVKPLVAAETTPSSASRRTASPDTRFSGQTRRNASPSSSRMTPHSKPTRYAEPSLGLSMEDIIGQQRREVELVKEAVAKRPLADIQQEQAFQEWWDQESRRACEEEARKAARGPPAREGDRERGKSRARRGRGKARGGGGTGDGAALPRRADVAASASRGRGDGHSRGVRGRGGKVPAS
ncbi:related to myosin-like protein [Cephalotrichum gorgonifer]|uniref:Related to myosin-like protein n=1 Tax=Cephalotrichum gorgonifer TaxID=2041049 RepID=A0AAE8MTS5_9PEZI|nr:related to myosin-like protein [Cephalotrichum gorgonifer]